MLLFAVWICPIGPRTKRSSPSLIREKLLIFNHIESLTVIFSLMTENRALVIYCLQIFLHFNNIEKKNSTYFDLRLWVDILPQSRTIAFLSAKVSLTREGWRVEEKAREIEANDPRQTWHATVSRSIWPTPAFEPTFAKKRTAGVRD